MKKISMPLLASALLAPALASADVSAFQKPVIVRVAAQTDALGVGLRVESTRIFPALPAAVPAQVASPMAAQAPRAQVQLNAAIPQQPAAAPQSGETAKSAADAAFTGSKPGNPSSETPVAVPDAGELPHYAGIWVPQSNASRPQAPKPPAPSRFWNHLPAISLAGSATMLAPAFALHAVQQAIGTGSILGLAVGGLQLMYWGAVGLTIAGGLATKKIGKREHPVERGTLAGLIGLLGAGAVVLGAAFTAFSFYAG